MEASVEHVPSTNVDDIITNMATNKLESLSTPEVYFPILAFIVVATMLSCLILFAKPSNSWSISSMVSGSPAASTTNIIVLSILLLAGGILIILLFTKTFRTITQILYRLNWVVALIAFIISLVVFYYQVDSSFILRYNYVIFVIVCISAALLFYKASQPSYHDSYKPNLQIEKIRFSLVYFLFLWFLFFMYFTDLGSVVSRFLGPSIIFTMVMLVIGFVYLLTLLSFPISATAATAAAAGRSESNFFTFFSDITWFGWVHMIFFFGTIVAFVAGVLSNPQYFQDASGVYSFKNAKFAFLCVMFSIILILWMTFFLLRIMKKNTNSISSSDKSQLNNIGNIAQQAINIVLAMALIGVVIGWIFALAKDYKTTSDIIPLLMNIMLILVILFFAYKYLANVTHFYTSVYYKLAINIIFYIPCLLYNAIEYTLSLVGIKMSSLQTVLEDSKNVQVGNAHDVWILGGVLLLNALYFVIVPYTANKIAKQGGNMLLLQPHPLSQSIVLGEYLKLNGIDTSDSSTPLIDAAGVHNYTYAISMWVYISSGSTTSTDDAAYTIMNYGEIPHIKWNLKKHELMITVKPEKSASSQKSEELDVDTDGNLVVYRSTDFAMQKWNNIIVNFSNGTFDIFINAKLVKSKAHTVPIVKYSSLSVGSSRLLGKICNVNYFTYSLSMQQIHYLYNLVKNSTPPIPFNSDIGTTEDVKYTPYAPPSGTLSIADIETDIEDVVADIEADVDDIGAYVVGESGSSRNDTNGDALHSPDHVNYLSPQWYFNQPK